jgi:hypothetical protein
VANTSSWVSPATIRTALAQAWGDGRGVLVTGSRPSVSDRFAERLWRRWGGQLERHPHRWALHRHATDTPARATTRRAAGADVCVAFGNGARVSSHDDCHAALDRARRSVHALTHNHPRQDQDEDNDGRAAQAGVSAEGGREDAAEDSDGQGSGEQR